MSSMPNKTSGTSKPGGPPRDSTKTQVPRPNKIERPDVDVINRAAEGFLQIYYDRMDGSLRDANIAKLYRESSVMTWNGETLSGAQNIKDFLAKMPESKHEIQSWDCHPIPGHSPAPILITVSGMVTHGEIPAKIPQTKKTGVLPRIFSQTFVLAPEPRLPLAAGAEATPQETEIYYVRSDTLRFVG